MDFSSLDEYDATTERVLCHDNGSVEFLETLSVASQISVLPYESLNPLQLELFVGNLH